VVGEYVFIRLRERERASMLLMQKTRARRPVSAVLIWAKCILLLPSYLVHVLSLSLTSTHAALKGRV
jgi:hypothetical protein